MVNQPTRPRDRVRYLIADDQLTFGLCAKHRLILYGELMGIFGLRRVSAVEADFLTLIQNHETMTRQAAAKQAVRLMNQAAETVQKYGIGSSESKDASALIDRIDQFRSENDLYV